MIAYNDKTKEILSGQVDVPKGFEHWLIKLDGVGNDTLADAKGYGRIEFAYSKMAIDCGISMTNSLLLEENGRAHFMTKRFDRADENQKLHMQSLCGIAHMDYNNPNLYSYEQAFQVMRQLKLPYIDAEQLFRRMCFNNLGRNFDDHTKNISFLMDKNGKWGLSPAYDISFAYDPANVWLKRHQMSINGKREDVSDSDLLQVAKQTSIKKPKEIIENVKDTLSRWNEYAKNSDLSQDQTRIIWSNISKGIVKKDITIELPNNNRNISQQTDNDLPENNLKSKRGLSNHQ